MAGSPDGVAPVLLVVLGRVIVRQRVACTSRMRYTYTSAGFGVGSGAAGVDGAGGRCGWMVGGRRAGHQGAGATALGLHHTHPPQRCVVPQLWGQVASTQSSTIPSLGTQLDPPCSSIVPRFLLSGI